jgi:hypothetical protein
VALHIDHLRSVPADFSPGDYFAYITAAMSIVLGLGIVTCLNGIAKMLVNRNQVRIYWVQVVWVVQILLTQIQCFWTLLQNREVIMGLTFFEYVAFWLYPLALYLISALLFPADVGDEPVSFRDHYYDNNHWIFAVGTVPPVLFLAFHLIYLDIPPIALQNAFPALFAAITVTLAITDRPRIHAVLTPVLPVLFVVVIALYRLQPATTSGALTP